MLTNLTKFIAPAPIFSLNAKFRSMLNEEWKLLENLL